MATVITALYDDYEDSARTLQDLDAAGVPHDDITILSHRADRAHQGRDYREVKQETHASSGAGTGAAIGGVLGGGAGLLAGLGIIAIPGVGPVVAAGWLIAALVGAAAGATAGGIVGALTGAGIPEEEAHVYAEGVRRGGTVLMVRVAPERAPLVRGIMYGHNAVDIEVRRDRFREEGWERFDARREPLTERDIRRTPPPPL